MLKIINWFFSSVRISSCISVFLSDACLWIWAPYFAVFWSLIPIYNVYGDYGLKEIYLYVIFRKEKNHVRRHSKTLYNTFYSMGLVYSLMGRVQFENKEKNCRQASCLFVFSRLSIYFFYLLCTHLFKLSLLHWITLIAYVNIY